jgi:trehalose 6-phosphate phosphatase
MPTAKTSVRTTQTAAYFDPAQSVDISKFALFLDIDGTLIDIASVPTAVVIPRELVALLEKARSAFDGALAIVSGRRIHEIDAMLSPALFAASGVHGCELRSAPNGPIVSQAAADIPILPELHELAHRFPGVLVEPKGSGVAIHYRLVPARGDDIQQQIYRLMAGVTPPLQLIGGRMVFEILPRGQSKGSAVDALMTREPFIGRLPIMIGDDIGDASAFAVAERNGGMALTVAGEHYPPASAQFDSPAAVRSWLDRIATS